MDLCAPLLELILSSRLPPRDKMTTPFTYWTGSCLCLSFVRSYVWTRDSRTVVGSYWSRQDSGSGRTDLPVYSQGEGRGGDPWTGEGAGRKNPIDSWSLHRELCSRPPSFSFPAVPGESVIGGSCVTDRLSTWESDSVRG